MPRQGAVRDYEAVNATMSLALYDFIISIGRQLYLCQVTFKLASLSNPTTMDVLVGGYFLLCLRNKDPVARDPTYSASLVEFHCVFTSRQVILSLPLLKLLVIRQGKSRLT
jgi:hypothetical protein